MGKNTCLAFCHRKTSTEADPLLCMFCNCTASRVLTFGHVGEGLTTTDFQAFEELRREENEPCHVENLCHRYAGVQGASQKSTSELLELGLRAARCGCWKSKAGLWNEQQALTTELPLQTLSRFCETGSYIGQAASNL